MKLKTQTPKFLQQRKFLMALPLLALPFITLLFWALGGGKISNANAQLQDQKGFNMALPDAYLKEEKTLDKLSYYEKAASDSAKLNELMKNDPYYTLAPVLDTGSHRIKDTLLTGLKHKRNPSSRMNTSPYSSSANNDPNEAKIYQKLEQLNATINKTVPMPETKTDDSYSNKSNASVTSKDINRLEQMMQVMNQKEGEDPEMQQLNGVLEKIMDIQHPERVQEKIRQTSEKRKGQVFAVSAFNTSNPVSVLENTSATKIRHDTIRRLANEQNDFYSLDDLSVENNQNAIEAVVHETQTLVNGAAIKLRLINDVYVNGVLIPKDNFLFGTASVDGERLNIKINSIHYMKSLFPVELSVYDIDGMEGIYIPGAITQDVAKQSADRAIQNIGFSSLDPSLGAQAASAGIEAAKSLLTKKVKLIKVTVKAGYQVLLRDEKQKQED